MMNTPRPNWWLHGLHFLLALSLPFILAFALGCKKAEEEKEDLGPEVPGDSIDLALSKAINDADLSKVAVGQYAEYSVTQLLENQETVTAVGAKRVDVVDKSEAETTVKFTMRIIKSWRQNDDTWETTVTEEPLELNKPSLLSVGESQAANLVKAAAAPGDKPKRITFHKLRESTRTVEPPYRVRMKADCGGLNPCEIAVRYIRFDLVQWFTDEEYRKISYDFGFATATPYLPFGQDFDQFAGILVNDCRSTYLPIEGRTVYVRECQNLEDFQK